MKNFACDKNLYKIHTKIEVNVMDDRSIFYVLKSHLFIISFKLTFDTTLFQVIVVSLNYFSFVLSAYIK